MKNLDDYKLDTPMKKILVLMNLSRFSGETDVPYWSMRRYLKGNNEDLRHTYYQKIRDKIRSLVNEL